MNNTLEGINSRITEAEEWISDLQDRTGKSLPENRIVKNNNNKEKTLMIIADLEKTIPCS